MHTSLGTCCVVPFFYLFIIWLLLYDLVHPHEALYLLVPARSLASQIRIIHLSLKDFQILRHNMDGGLLRSDRLTVSLDPVKILGSGKTSKVYLNRDRSTLFLLPYANRYDRITY